MEKYTFKSIALEEKERLNDEINRLKVDWINEYTEPQNVFKTFREYINEAPQWVNDDCGFKQETLQRLMGNEDFLESFRWSGTEDYRCVVNKGVGKSKDFIILTNDLSTHFLGHYDNGYFKKLSVLNYMQGKTYKGIGTVYEIKEVNTHSKFRKNGFADALYRSALFEGMVLMSDAIQYKGAVKIWKNFISTHEEWKTIIDDKKIKVSLYSKIKSKIVIDDITGMDDDQIWSHNDTKQELRLVASLR